MNFRKGNQKYFKVYFFFLLLGFPWMINAQIPDANSLHDTINQDDLGDFKSEFQETFFEALTYRATENYERAITSLHKAEDFEVDNLTVYFELGKNYASLEDFLQAENYFLKVLEKRPQDILVLQELKNIYQTEKNYPKAIQITEKLKDLDLNYAEDLAKFYLKNEQYKKALETLDEYEAKKGFKKTHQQLKTEIYEKAKPVEIVEEYLKNKLKENPENRQNYTALINLYLASKQQQKAEEIAKDLQDINPENSLAHLVLYKKSIKNNKEEAVSAMKIILNSSEIEGNQKEMVLKELNSFLTENPEYKEEFAEVLSEENLHKNQSDVEKARFYKEKDKQKAMEYFEKALKNSPNDFKLIREILDLQIEEKQYEKALALAEEKLVIFPTQALLYYYIGKAENALEKYESAKENLHTGVDFVIDNSQLTLQFYQELAKSYQKLGNSEKASEFEQKANNLK